MPTGSPKLLDDFAGLRERIAELEAANEAYQEATQNVCDQNAELLERNATLEAALREIAYHSGDGDNDAENHARCVNIATDALTPTSGAASEKGEEG